MTDHSSTEGTAAILATAIAALTGHPPTLIDARVFLIGGCGRVTSSDGVLQLREAVDRPIVTPSAVVIYEIRPADRAEFAACQHSLAQHGAISLGTDADAWRAATHKDVMVARFAEAGIRQMQTICLPHQSTLERVVAAFESLGRNVWARPAVGLGGEDVFHITNYQQLRRAAGHYTVTEQDWLVARDAHNFNTAGLRHQFRLVVLDGRVIRACEHIQHDPDAPCNESQGAISILLPLDRIPADLAQLAISATKALGLRFGGVDLAAESGGVVFEVNVHPMFDAETGLATVAIPYVEAHTCPSRWVSQVSATAGTDT